jgi:FMN phosphatase YigB (HAD superfamily)
MDRGNALLRTIRASVIGDDAVLEGPFGPRRIVYAEGAAAAGVRAVLVQREGERPAGVEAISSLRELPALL